ncbi:GmrSD restriction endonuclease domain-containing protein [Niveispirillum sp. KHB5.9]|uniref:GmrSD restriction endonuclease domain-containing protein n=1 Tax=Niveispirillum sp. KHB5.9 TaxID=3400269 RepID=UPI003A85B4B6
MQQQNISIGTLVDMYKRGELRLPEIQRHYVWRATRVRDLLDSLYRGYPSGSILMWETDEPVPTRDFAIAQETTAFAGRKLLLDGQQRLTSLTAVLGGASVAVRGRKRPIDILFNLDHDDGPPVGDTEVDSDDPTSMVPDDELADDADEGDASEPGIQERLNRRTFVVASRALAALPNWVSVGEVFRTSNDAVILEKAGIESFKDPRFQKYSDRLKKLRAIKDYQYVVHVLERQMSYEEVTEIFVRVNSLGAKLRSSDLALAQMTSRWPNLIRALEEFQAECEQNWFTIELGQLVRAIVVFATRQCLFRSVASTPIEVLKEGWKQAQEGLRFAINFLRSNAGIEDETLLSSPMFIHALAAVSHVKDNKLTAEEQSRLLHWLLVANARGRYSRGSTETLLNEDLAIIFRTGDIKALIEPVRRQFGRLHIEPTDLMARGANSPLFSLAYLALKAAGAKDWYSGLGLSLTHQGKLHFIQWHHIIPKSLLKDHGYETGEINEIGNMAFITGQTNRRISNKEPSSYLLDVVQKQGELALRSQCVPTIPDLWKTESYRDFLRLRREMLAERMNAFIREKAQLSTTPGAPEGGLSADLNAPEA